MRSASVSEVKEHFHDYLAALDREPVLILSEGTPTAVLIRVAPGQDPDALVSGAKPKLAEILAASRADIQAGRHVSEEEFWAEVSSRASRTAAQSEP